MRTMIEFVNRLPDSFKNRSTMSYVAEWRAHNLLYELGIDVDRARIVDLDVGETLIKRFLYVILSILYFG